MEYDIHFSMSTVKKKSGIPTTALDVGCLCPGSCEYATMRDFWPPHTAGTAYGEHYFVLYWTDSRDLSNVHTRLSWRASMHGRGAGATPQRSEHSFIRVPGSTPSSDAL